VSVEQAVAADRQMLENIIRASRAVELCPEHGEENFCCRPQVLRWIAAYRRNGVPDGGADA
jgi:hypothetical protein